MEQYTAENILSFGECEEFVRSFCTENPFSDPMLSNVEAITADLRIALKKKENHGVIGIYKNQKLVGLFSFLVLRDDRYLEMLIGFSDDKKAYHRMLAYLKENFAACNADIVFNPNNHWLYDCLKEKDAEFEPEQQTMIYHTVALGIDTSGVELLTEPYLPSYLAMHNTDLYWTGDKVTQAEDRFRAFVAIERGSVVGYLDVTHCYEENEIYDLLVKEEYRRKGYGRKLLAKALELNRPNGMMLLVNIENQPAIRLYESLGFVKAENRNSLVAHLQL